MALSKMLSVTMNCPEMSSRRFRHSCQYEEDVFAVFEGIMVEPTTRNGRTRPLHSLLDSKLDAPVGDSDDAKFFERKDHARDGRESLRLKKLRTLHRRTLTGICCIQNPHGHLQSGSVLKD